MQQVIWYLAYDGENLYLAMDSPNPPGTWPRARVKPEDALERIHHRLARQTYAAYLKLSCEKR